MRLRLYFDKFGDIIIPFPDFSEQQKIVRFLDYKTALTDKAINIKQKKIELLKERRQVLIHNAVTRGLNLNIKMKDSGVEWIGEIPEHWKLLKFKHIADYINRGISPDYLELSNWKVINQATFSPSWKLFYLSQQ